MAAHLFGLVIECDQGSKIPTEISMIDYTTGEALLDINNSGEILGVAHILEFKKAWNKISSWDFVIVNDWAFNHTCLWVWSGDTYGLKRFIDLQTMAKFLNDSCLMAFGNPFFTNHITGDESISWKEQGKYFYPDRNVDDLSAAQKNQLFFDIYGEHLKGFSKLFKGGIS